MIIILVLGATVTSGRSENHENEEISDLPKMNFKSYQSKIKHNNSTELLGYYFHNVHNKNGPPDPLDPKSAIFLELSCLCSTGARTIWIVFRRIASKSFGRRSIASFFITANEDASSLLVASWSYLMYKNCCQIKRPKKLSTRNTSEWRSASAFLLHCLYALAFLC